MEINRGEKRGEQKPRNGRGEGLVMWVLLEYVMTMYAIGELLALC